MTRLTSLPVAVVVCLAGFSAQLSAQVPSPVAAVAQIAAAHGELQGVVTNESGEPLAGAVVSALGSTTAFAVTDRAGRFAFRTLPPGPYLVRAHLQGYIPPRASVVQVNSALRATSTIALIRRAPSEAPQVLAAGLGGAESIPLPTTEEAEASDSSGSGETDDHSHGESAWRLRHLKRSVLKEVESGVLIDEDSFIEDSFATLGRAMEQSARAASSLFTGLPTFSGEVNFLTTGSFDRPQDLFTDHGIPRGIAFVSLTAPTGAGDWNVRGAVTHGDLASWVVSGSYARRSMGAHQYDAGLLYSMQRYDDGNPAALAAVADGSRNAGEVFGYDRWTLRPGLTLHYGARYARYDYLEDDALFSPRIGVVIQPNPVLRLRVSASRREMAPGAEEFLPQGALGVFLPPERTFSPLSGRGFATERLEHYEVGAEQTMGAGIVIAARAFRQSVNDQMVTLFGLPAPARWSDSIGHYYVASAGDFEARGWGVSVSREITGYIHGTLSYTRSDADWLGRAPDWQVLSVTAEPADRSEREKVHDLTTSLQTQIPPTATRVFVVYKLNSGFADGEIIDRAGSMGARFDLQIHQALPFLNFTAAQWEMLVSVRNLFREDLLDASMFDELLVVKPPKRIVGGLTVRF